MKKFTSTLILLFITSLVGFAQLRIGFVGGVQSANIIAKDASETYTASYKTGFQLGITIDKSITDHFSIRPQLLYSLKGTKNDPINIGFGYGIAESSFTLSYLELPVQLMYGIEAGPGKILLGAGPYLAYGLSGKSTAVLAGKSETESIEFGLSADQIKRIDFGLKLSAGYELTSGISFSAHFTPGLANLSNEPATTAKNTVFGASVGFLLGAR